MADTVHIPAVGDVKKSYAIAGGAVTIGIVGYAYYKKRQSNNAAAVAAASTTTPVDTSSYDSSNGIDPATGIPYSQEEGPGIGYSDTGGSYYGSGQITGYDQYGNPIYSTGITGSNIYTTNSAWATQAENDLQAAGVDYSTAANAISSILAGLSVTTAQQDLFMQAIGLDGQPPQGYPTPIKVVNTPAQTNTVKVPGVIGQTAGNANNSIVNAGLQAYNAQANAKGEASKKVKSQNPAPGTMVTPRSRVTIST